MKNEFMLAINQLCNERNLSRDVIIDAIEMALVSAYKKTPRGNAIHVTAKIDPMSGKALVYAHKQVVEEVKDDRQQISLERARKLQSDVKLGDVVDVEITPKNFGRIAAQTAKQVIMQRIREAEREALFDNYVERRGEIVHGTVQSVGPQGVTLNLGNAEALLARTEQIPGERYRTGQRIRAYLLDVNRSTRGPQISVSRTHRDFLRRLLELEVPEIYSGTVEIRAIAREPGSRSKVAVVARQEGIDPVGSCVGMRGVRIQNIVNELSGEKIDVVEWNSDSAVFIGKALSPATVISVHLTDDKNGQTASVVVPDKQLSLAIGKQGQNARLAAKLTGWRIDIKKEAEAHEEAVRRAAEELARAEERAALEAARALLAEAEAAAEAGEAAAVAEVPTAEEAIEELAVADEAVVELPAAGEIEPVAAEVVEEAISVEQPEVTASEPEPEPATAIPAVELADRTEPEEPKPGVKTPDGKFVIPKEWFEWTGDAEGVGEVGEEESEEEEEDTSQRSHDKKKRKRIRRQLVFDEVTGEVVVHRKRKPGRRRDPWDSDSHDV